MLSVSPIKASPDAVRYYASLGQGAATDYYVAAGEERGGLYWGEGARALGLTGEVDAKVFSHLLNGFGPDGKTKLVQNAGKENRRAAFDLTFTGPKSFDALYSIAPEAERAKLEEAFERSVYCSASVGSGILREMS